MAAPHSGPCKPKELGKILPKLEEIWAIGGTDLNACYHAEVSQDYYYNLLKKNPWLAERRAMLREQPIKAALKCVTSHIGKQPELALKFLSKRFKAEYADRTELTGAEGKDFIPVLFETAQIEQIEEPVIEGELVEPVK